MSSFASSYIKTVTVAVARNADVLTYPSAGNVDGTKGWCSATAGNTFNTAGLRQSLVSTYPSANGLVLNTYSATNPAILEFYDGSAFRSGNSVTLSTTPTKFGATWGGSACQTSYNGTNSASLTFDGDAAAGTAIAIGNYTDGSGTGWFGNIRDVRIGQRALSSSELQAITS